MRSFLECRGEISFYMKELTFFELDERVFSQLWQTVWVLFFCLIEYFFILTAIFYSYCEGRIFFYWAEIFSRCAKIYPQWFTFETKEREQQTETETETETISKCLVGPIHVPIHFQGETKNKKQKIKDKR